MTVRDSSISSIIARPFLLAVLFASLSASDLSAQTTVDNRAGIVGPGDVLRIRIWREPDLSGDFAVSATGHVVLPRLGELQVASIPGDSLQPFLTDRYRFYLNNPSIEVLLLRRVRVTGAVRNPGVYPLDPTLTISDAVALAGGPAEDGKRDKVEIRREGKVIVANLRNDVVIANSPIQSGDQLYVPTKAWLSRNMWLVSGAVTTATAVLLTRAVR
jgi:polysaccharide export outer membrane protein